MRARATAWFAGGLLALSPARAQEPQFTQFYAAPTYLSPAFAGTAAQSRLAMQYRDQWPAIPGSFVTYNLAFDHYLNELHSGIGLLATRDQAGSGALSYTSIKAQYAYEIELKRKVFLRPALQFGYVNHALDYSRLVFGDQLARGGATGTYENLNKRSVGYMDMGAGLLFFTPKLWLGMSLDHLNEPNQSLRLGESLVPRRFSMHGGYRHTIRTAVIRKHAQAVVAAFNYKAQGLYDQLDIGAYYELDPIFVGLWYRGLPVKHYEPGRGNSDALAVLAGITVNDWRIGYSYDLTLSMLADRTGGSHEISIVYDWADRRRRKAMSKRRVVPCAKF